MNDFFDTRNEPSLPVEFAPEERRQLLEDIGFLCLSVNQAPGENTLRLAHSELSNDLIAANSPFVRLQRLEEFAAQILPLLLAAAKQPDTVLAVTSRRLPLDRLRGNSTTLSEIARSPQVQFSLVKPRSPLPLLSESHSALSFNTPANRLIAALLRQLSAEANTLALLAAFCADMEAEAQARHLENRTRSLLSQELWREQRLLPPSQITSLLPVCRAKASLPYRLLLDHWQQYREKSAGFDWSGLATLTLSERALWQVYEIWCFLQIAQAAQSLGWRLIGNTQIQITAEGMHLVPATGQTSCLSFAPPNTPRKSKDSILRLFYQPLFVSANRPPTPEISDAERYVSRSHAMQPDYVLNFRGRLIVFDAKLRSYSVVGAEQEDIDKMHAYRDGIVRHTGQSVRSAVSAAWCLFPGMGEQGERGNREQGTGDRATHADIRAYPAPTETHPFGNGDIGAIRLRPLDVTSQETLQKLLTTLL